MVTIVCMQRFILLWQSSMCACHAPPLQALQALGQAHCPTELSFLPAISASARQQEAAVAQQLLQLAGCSLKVVISSVNS